MKTCSWLCVIAGIWLIIAPFILGYSDNVTALWNDIILGLIVLGIGAFFCSSKKRA